MNEIEPALSSAAAARFLGVSLATMATWRHRGNGPPVYYAGEKPIYRLSELRAWVTECTALMASKREQRATEASANGNLGRGRPKASVGPVGRRL